MGQTSKCPLGAEVVAILPVQARRSALVPFVTANVAAGFPSPADDYLDNPLDFNELLIENPAATFAVRVGGDSMIGIGIFPNDIAIVNRARTAVDRSVVLALLNGEFTLKRYRKRDGRAWLEAANSAYPNIDITEDSAFEVWGVVTNSIRIL
jgi:DNA polymerase V